MNYLFTSESVSEGHPDKVADQISDAVLDQMLAYDPDSKVACETLVTTGQVGIAGEVKSKAQVDLADTARRVINSIGYNHSALKFDGESCGVLSAVHEQSPDINRGVERSDAEEQGAGDQGMMFGYACNETPVYIPLTVSLSHHLLKELSKIRREESAMTYITPEGKRKSYLRPDSKSQVTVEYDDHNHPVRVDTIVISTQHDDFIPAADGKSQAEADEEMLAVIRHDVETELLPRALSKLPEDIRALFGKDIKLHVNPTGKFVIGGPHGDTGLTGRKIIVDTYGGRGAHGGGAFSGKDPSKVDRSAAYAARHIPKNLYVNTRGTAKVDMTDGEISRIVSEIFDMRPNAIERRLKLRQPIYLETATYGHIGRTPRKVTKTFHSRFQGDRTLEVELFTWEKLDYVETVREAFGLK